MGFRSPTCASRSTGKPLMAYATEAEAQSQACQTKASVSRDFCSYHCHVCRLWHLKPEPPNRERWARCGYCEGRDGSAKVSYPTSDDAERQAERFFERLRAYECPYTDAWHLTSRR